MHAGRYVQQERFPWYYGDNIDSNNFLDHNSIAAATVDKRVNSFIPSVAERTLVDAIDFQALERPKETRIFRGKISPSICTEGDYLFRITSDDASHLILNNVVIIDNGGSHGPQSKTVKVNLGIGNNREFQVYLFSPSACNHECSACTVLACLWGCRAEAGVRMTIAVDAAKAEPYCMPVHACHLIGQYQPSSCIRHADR